MKIAKHIPNAISILRLVTFLSLPGITQISDSAAMKLTFTLVFCFVGLTDVLDGWIARKFHLQSELGAKLDNIADTCVFCVGFISLMFLLKLKFYPDFAHCIIPLGIATALKVFSFALTRVRFGQWNTMHTWLNKSLGTVIFLCIPCCIWMDSIDYRLAIAVSAFIALTVAEDTFILLTSETYNVNHRGILFERNEK